MPGPLGVSLEDASTVRTARILVIEDNGSDVFLLERALNQQDLRFELVHLLERRRGPGFHPQAGRLCGRGDSRHDPVGLEPVEVYRRRHIARDPRRHAPRRHSGVRVEFFPVPARRGSPQGTRSFPIHHQACRSGPVHGDRQNPQGSSRRSQSRMTELQFSQLSSPASRWDRAQAPTG